MYFTSKGAPGGGLPLVASNPCHPIPNGVSVRPTDSMPVDGLSFTDARPVIPVCFFLPSVLTHAGTLNDDAVNTIQF